MMIENRESAGAVMVNTLSSALCVMMSPWGHVLVACCTRGRVIVFYTQHRNQCLDWNTVLLGSRFEVFNVERI